MHEASLRSAIPDLYLQNQTAYLRILGEAVHGALIGRESARAALRRAADQWSLLNRRGNRAAQVARWARLRAKYPAEIRRALRDVSS